MLKSFFILTTLLQINVFASIENSAAVKSQQVKPYQIIQLNNQIMLTQQILNTKIIDQQKFRTKLEEINSNINLTQGLHMKAKSASLYKEKSLQLLNLKSVENDIQVLNKNLSQLLENQKKITSSM